MRSPALYMSNIHVDIRCRDDISDGKLFGDRFVQGQEKVQHVG